jgi:alanine racemase
MSHFACAHEADKAFSYRQLEIFRQVQAGLSYGHTFHTMQPSVIVTIPLGGGDGLSQRCSNALELLVHGRRCRQVGQICMDQCLLDVKALRGQVNVGDEMVIIGRQSHEEVTADALTAQLGTINYAIVSHIARRVPRSAVRSALHEGVECGLCGQCGGWEPVADSWIWSRWRWTIYYVVPRAGPQLGPAQPEPASRMPP